MFQELLLKKEKILNNGKRITDSIKDGDLYPMEMVLSFKVYSMDFA